MFFDKVFRVFVGLLLTSIIARYLGPEKYGVLSYVLSIVGIFLMLSTFGLQGLVVRDIVNDNYLIHETLGSATLIVLITSTLSYIILAITILIFNENNLIIVKLILIVGLLIFLKFTDIVSYWFEAKVASKCTVIAHSICYIIFAFIKIFFKSISFISSISS